MLLKLMETGTSSILTCSFRNQKVWFWPLTVKPRTFYPQKQNILVDQILIRNISAEFGTTFPNIIMEEKGIFRFCKLVSVQNVVP